MSGYADALAFLQRQARPSAPPPGGSPALEAQRLDFETPLPEMSPDGAPLDDSLAFPQDIENSLTPLEEVNAATETAAPPRAARSNGYSDALAFLNRQAEQALTQQAVTEATTPDDRLPIVTPELADALGVLDYRDPQEGQRRQQAAAIGEILNLPMFERVNLGAAPVNPDGTVTIRRAQAVSPEAQAAADEQMEIIRLAAAKNLNPPTPSFLEKIQQRWRLGREAASDDQLAYRALMGEVDWNQVKDQLDPSEQPQRGGNWLSEGFLGAVQMLPPMVDGIISGTSTGLQGAMAGGTAAAIAGQLGPQALAPEELLTVPAAAAAGYSAGQAAGSSQYWYKQGAGSMYHALRKEGIPHEIASNVSAGFGAPYAGIELAQVTKLVPGLKQTAAQAVAGGLKKRLAALAVEKTGEYATQIGQETLQEANNITGEALAEWIAGVKPPPEKASAWDRIAGTIKESALSIPFLMAPKGVVDTVQTVRSPDQNQTTPPPPPPTAPAEVPQNFTPISSPAPAPGPVAPAPAPQNLGQVRAPEIPIDQAALDEAFGSPFAPPQPAPADPFAPSPLSETTPTTFAAPSSAISVPESTGSSELIAGEGSSSSQPVSSKAPKPNAATPPDNADFGPAFPEFTGNPIGAFAKLEETKTGEVPAALNHPTIGAVDVIWGQEGKTKASGFGLSKILKHHPEARPILENLFDAFDVKSENENTIQLELGDYSAVLRKNWKGQEKRWLLTSFGRNSAADGRTIDIPAPVSKSGDDTAPTKSGKQNKQPLKTNVNRFKSEAGYIDMGAVQDFGNSIYAAGVSFSKWAGQMLAKFGESISSALKSIWAAVSGQNYLPQARERGSVNISPSTGPKPRKFTQSVQAAPGVASEVKAQLTAIDYDPISNAQTVASARARIDAVGSMDSAVTQFMGNAANPDFQPTAVDYATGIELLGQLQSRGRHEDAAAIADFMARAGTTQGQAIQALSLISRLTPAGIEAFAARQITRAARNDPKIEELIQDNQRLRAEIAAAKRDSATAAIVDNRAAIKAALPAGADAVATNIAIREAILQSPTPLAAQAATARILQDNGLSEKAAIRLAEGITKDFLKITTDTRAKVLQDLLSIAETDRRLNKSKLGALIRLNREGKLTDSRLHADMAKMLGIPAWTSEHSAKVQRLINERERATDPRVKLVKAAEALDVIYREAMPPGILDKIDTYQTMAMLLNGLTQVRNLVGNISMAGVEIASDTVAQALDAVVGLGTGQRTRTGLDLGTRLTELGAGFQDIRAGYQFARAEGKGRRESFKEGVQTLIRLGRIYSSGKYDSQELTHYTGPVFNNPVMQTLENTLGAALSLADRGFYESAFKASLQNRMRTAAQNGTPMLAPDPDMIEQARMDAARAIYQDENIASKGFSGIRRVLNQITGSKRWGLGSMVLKFTQVPGSILMRGLEFTPINTIRVLYETVAPLLPRTVDRYHIGKDFDQKAFTEAFARSLIGTGFLATGYWLSHLGILSGGMDSDDENERELAKAEGWGPYRINVSALQRAMATGNFWTRQPRLKTDKVVKYDWLAPMSIGVAMGANMREGKDKILKEIQAGKRTSDFATTANWLLAAAGETAGVTASAMNTVLEQPMLSNLNQLFVTAGHSDAINALVKTAADIPGTMIPTVVKQWARYEDNIVRETRDGYDHEKLKFRQTVNELKAMLPGVSKTLPPRYDMEGNPVERFPNNGNTFFNVALNPAFVGYIKKSKLLSEMSDVYKATADGGVVPSRIPPKVSLENVEITLMPDEISALQKEYGMLSVAAAEKFVFSDPYYEKATWEQRAHALQKALTMAAKAAKYRVLQSRPDLYHRAKAEHIQRMESQRAANQQAQQDLAAVSQAMSQLQPGP